MTTKAQIINEAYSALRISGLTLNPSANDVQLALLKLENMMHELLGQWNFDIGYNFQQVPSTSDFTGVSPQFTNTLVTNLAVRLVPDFGKMAEPALVAQATQSLKASIGIVTAYTTREVQPPRRMPAGNGQTFRGLFWNRYMWPVDLAPNVAATKTIIQGETQDYFEEYGPYLKSAGIATFTIEADVLLTVVTSSVSGTRINYRLAAPANITDYGPWQQIKITMTDTSNRVDIRIINFNVIAPPQVGPNV
jgi:hypothetical protein